MRYLRSGLLLLFPGIVLAAEPTAQAIAQKKVALKASDHKQQALIDQAFEIRARRALDAT